MIISKGQKMFPVLAIVGIAAMMYFSSPRLFRWLFVTPLLAIPSSVMFYFVSILFVPQLFCFNAFKIFVVSFILIIELGTIIYDLVITM